MDSLEKSDQLVAREIHTCASTLIHELAQNEKYMEELMEVLTCTRTVYDCNECGTECSSEDEIETHLNEYCNGENNCGYTEREEEIEALEHWIVTPWLGRKLKEQGEMVMEFMDITIWGRTTSGQQIAADEVIQSIAEYLF